MSYTLLHGDCLELLPTLAAQSVDAIIADPPYGTTACKWDSVIPLAPMWAELKRVIKPRGAIVLFGAQPFTSALVMSNAGWFRYELVWDKVNKYTGSLNANRMPLRRHENMLVFYDALPTFNKQYRIGEPYTAHNTKGHGKHTDYGHGIDHRITANNGQHNPCSIVAIEGDVKTENGLHPTQKPVDLLRYLIRTYTNPGETVLDFTMGSGTTGVACAMEGRDFIGIELDPGYCDIARKRIEAVQPALLAVTA